MINWKIILDIGRTHLLSKFKQTAIAALGVTFGIGAYITLVSFMTGLNSMLDDMVLNRTPHVHLYNEIKPSEEQPISLYDNFEEGFNVVQSVKPKISQQKIHNALPILNLLKENEMVLGATGQASTQIFIITGSSELGGNLTGINAQEEARLFNLGDYVIEGDLDDLNTNSNNILLGKGIAKKLSLSIGDRIKVSTTSGSIFPLKIIGFYQSGLAEIDDVQSFVNLKTVQKIMGKSDNYITDINVKMHDATLAPGYASQLASQFNVTAIDIKTANAQFETGTQIRNIITYAVSVTLLIVAGFGIYNILNMLIYEKMNDIAILKAVGFSGVDVQMIFMSQALIIGVLGGVLGLLIGFGLSELISHIPFETEALPTIKTFPVNMNGSYYGIGMIFALVSTFFAGYFPSQKAKKIDAVRIIQGQ